MILEALWQARLDILLAFCGVACAVIGLRTEFAERRRLARMAQECRERQS